MITKFKDYLAKTNLAKEHSGFVCMDGELLPQPLWGNKQEKPVGL